MTAPQFLDKARELDRDIAFLDALSEAAERTHAHPRIRLRLLVVRNAKVHEWSEAWHTQRVSP
jgi:hypothetical protein